MLKQKLNFIMHIIDIVITLRNSDEAYIVITKDKRGWIKIQEQAKLIINRKLGSNT